MEFTIINLLVISVITVIATVTTNNKYKVDRDFRRIFYIYIAYVGISLFSGITKMILNAYIYFIVIFIFAVTQVLIMYNRNKHLSTVIWYKAKSYESVPPTNEDVINGICTIKINNTDYTMNGRVYSNKQNIVVNVDNSVEVEVYEYNMFYAQELILVDIGIVYLMLDYVSYFYTIAGSLFILATLVNYIRSKISNKSVDLLLDTVYKISITGAVALCILLIFNKV